MIKSSDNSYPFINPIIVSKDGGIIDGQYRFSVCKSNNQPIEYNQIDYNSDELQNEDAIKEIREIQEQQKIKLEKWFKRNNINFKEQLKLCSSNDRMEKFFENEVLLLTDEDYWTTLGDCYTRSNNNTKLAAEIKRAFSSNRSKREYLMSKEERYALKELPEKVTIYRGMSVIEEKKGDYGVSWTLNESVAEKFADLYMHNYDTRDLQHIVKKLTIKKSEIVAYFIDGSEEEIIYIHDQ